jgi:hypothetical protein
VEPGPTAAPSGARSSCTFRRAELLIRRRLSGWSPGSPGPSGLPGGVGEVGAQFPDVSKPRPIGAPDRASRDGVEAESNVFGQSQGARDVAGEAEGGSQPRCARRGLAPSWSQEVHVSRPRPVKSSERRCSVRRPSKPVVATRSRAAPHGRPTAVTSDLLLPRVVRAQPSWLASTINQPSRRPWRPFGRRRARADQGGTSGEAACGWLILAWRRGFQVRGLRCMRSQIRCDPAPLAIG